MQHIIVQHKLQGRSFTSEIRADWLLSLLTFVIYESKHIINFCEISL